MATYKVIDAEKLDNDLKSVADSIRAKSGITEVMNFPDGFNSAIAGIISGSQNPDLPEVAENLDTELNEQEELISELKSVLTNKSNSTNSGIIDITELPTSDIDENVVYRLTETVQTEKTEVYIKDGNYVATFAEYCVDEGVPTTPNIYVVNDLTNMLETDVQTYSAIHIYILRSDGIAYANAPAYGGITTVGLFGWQAMGYDKGFTEDIQCEAEDGVYTTIEAFKEVVRYFTYEDGEWKQFINGYYTSGDFLQLSIEHIPKEYFYLSDGSYATSVGDYKFVMNQSIRSIELPDTIRIVGLGAFAMCSGLKTVTLPPNLKVIRSGAFGLCTSLVTIEIPPLVSRIESEAFASCSSITSVTFKGTPTFIESDVFKYCTSLITINVPWSEDDPINENAPWGATNAEINFNCTEG